MKGVAVLGTSGHDTADTLLELLESQYLIGEKMTGDKLVLRKSE